MGLPLINQWLERALLDLFVDSIRWPRSFTIPIAPLPDEDVVGVDKTFVWNPAPYCSLSLLLPERKSLHSCQVAALVRCSAATRRGRGSPCPMPRSAF